MQKVRGHVLAVAGRVLFIGFSVQIVLGFLWMVCNFHLLYFMQLVVAFFAAYRLLCAITNTGKIYRVWGSLALITFPLAMHCHMLGGPNSLSASCLLLESAYATELLKGRRENKYREFALVLYFWLLATLIQREYLYFGAIPVGIVCIYMVCIHRGKPIRGTSNQEEQECNGNQSSEGKRKKIGYYVAITAACVGLMLTGLGLLPAGNTNNDMHRSVCFSLASRFAWPRIAEDYAFWPEEVRMHLTEQDARQADLSPKNMESVLGSTLEDALGEKEAKKVYAKMARGAWQRHRGDILHDTAWDILGYTFSPIVLQRQLTGKVYASYSGRNYDSMRAEAPLLTKYYLDYSCWWFVTGLLFTVVLSLLEAVNCMVSHRNIPKANRTKVPDKGVAASRCMYLFVAGMMVIWYTMRGAGMMDYKNTITVGILWCAWMLAVCVKGLCEPEKMGMENR